MASTTIHSIAIFSPAEYIKMQKLTRQSKDQINKILTNSVSYIQDDSNSNINFINLSDINSEQQTVTTINESITATVTTTSTYSNTTNNLATYNYRNENIVNNETNELNLLQQSAMRVNGLNIEKLNRYSSFKVVALNITILKTRVPNNLFIGDTVLEINDIQLQVHDNIFAAQLLSSEILVSIRSYTPRRIEDDATSTITSTNNNNAVRNNSQSETTPERRNLNVNFERERSPQSETNPIRRNANDNACRSIVLEWDYEHPCPNCGCIYLKLEKNRKICCNNGQYLIANSTFPKINPLPP